MVNDSKKSNSHELDELRKRLAELENLLRTASGEKDDDESKIQMDEYISVMSLIPYNLNLCTKEGGQGNVKKFTKFGEVKRILYKDLVDILEVNSNFLEAGYFYILHPSLIRRHGLDDIYSKILTKEKIDEILSTSSEESVELYNSANERQQEIIIELLIDKIKADPSSVNLNVIDRLSRVSKVDIMKKVEDLNQIELPRE